ncbi:TlpA family protein disulfide reductase [Ancylomarina longa]|nr:thioredoxin family protein [Ancylomarina longa]
MSKKTQSKYNVPKLTESKHLFRESGPYEIYSTTVKSTRDLIKESDKPYSLLVFYAHWCAPCHKNMPILNKFDLHNKDSINLIFISSSDWLEKDREIDYLRKYKVRNKISLIIDYKEYGSEFMNWNRISNFIHDLVPQEDTQYQLSNIGLPHYMLFNNRGELLLETGAPFDIEKYENLIRF